MTTEPERTKVDRLEDLARNSEHLEAVQNEFRAARAESRRISMELITIDKLPIAEVARLSGHHRNTLKVWLTIHNAEKK